MLTEQYLRKRKLSKTVLPVFAFFIAVFEGISMGIN